MKKNLLISSTLLLTAAFSFSKTSQPKTEAKHLNSVIILADDKGRFGREIQI